MSIETNKDILSLPIEILELNLRTYRILKRGNVSTLSDIVNLGENGLARIYQLGEKQIPDIFNKLNDFMTQSQGITLEEIRSKIPPTDPRPLLFTVSDSETPNLAKIIVPFVKTLMGAIEQERDYEVLKLRYGLENEKVYTLQEIGDYYGISRERVRQLENQAKGNIQKAIDGTLRTKKWRLPQIFQNETVDLLSSLPKLGNLLTEKEIVYFIQNRYSFTLSKNELGSIRLLLSLAGFEALPKATSNKLTRIFIEPSWELSGKVDKNLLYGVINSVYHLLLKEVKPISKFEIVVQINRALKKRVEPIYLEYATKICPDIERLDDETFQFRFESLPSIGDKAYRVLHQANKPLHIRDILREINRLQVKTGGQADALVRTLQQQLGSDNRFEPIGRSGEWSLTEWEHIAKETFLHLMQEFLHLKQTSATAKEIFDYVHSKREGVKLNSIQAFLVTQKSIFTRVAYGKYGLTAWGLKSMPSERSQVDIAGIYTQIDATIKAIFVSKNTDKLPLWSVVENVREQTGRSALTIRKRISESPNLELEPHPTHPKRKYLKYLGDGQHRVINAKAEKPKILIRDNVKKEIENFLLQQPENSAPLSVIASHVMKKTGCIKPTFYQYLSEMETIRKSQNDSVVICKLVETSKVNEPLSFPQIETATDVELKDNLKRAISNLNIDNVDLGLFQLGKIFESELRSFLKQAKAKNTFLVVNKDLERLVDMIDCVERNKVITQKHHLTLLRENRNERAHGDVSNFTERQKLMQHAPFLGDLYIKYIILLNDKRHKL